MKDTIKVIQNEICKLWEAIADINRMTSPAETYSEPEPDHISDTSKTMEPQFKVGDWVEYMDRQMMLIAIPSNEDKLNPKSYLVQDYNGDECRLYADNITRKLSSSEVKVKITLEGTVRSSINDCCFELSTPNGGWATIGFNEIDPATSYLVRELIKKGGSDE